MENRGWSDEIGETGVGVECEKRGLGFWCIFREKQVPCGDDGQEKQLQKQQREQKQILHYAQDDKHEAVAASSGF